MKKISCLLGLIGLGWILYGLFQPIIDWNFGWEKMPKNRNELTFQGIEDKKYLNAIESSKHHLDSLIEMSEAPSISVAAMINGKMIWTFAIGYQDIKNQVSSDTSSQYRIGSVSKALTSLGLGNLIENRLIDPDSSIQYYTGQFQNQPRMTIRQLASHQSGIRNYETCFCFPIWEYYHNNEYESVETSLSQFEKDNLLFTPGESFAYSSYNFTALSLAMEKVSGRDFLLYMRDHVFKPLKMSMTQSDDIRDISADRAIPYDTDVSFYKNAFDVDLSNKWAGGGFISTPSDLVRAGNALLDSSFLSQTTIEMLTSPQKLNDGTINEQNYALGWRHDFSEKYFNGNRKVEVIHHGGMAVGGMALLAVYPEYDLVFAITTNKSGQKGRFELFDYIRPMVELFIRQSRE
ncbi:serine hydrolase domain-containing protein [Ekhidna sp.]|uniref:serine hydrolase domain-containing protein n=1 Tax=Ekhidna sp. TaxID=2608089 RepID=UPI003B5A01E4